MSASQSSSRNKEVSVNDDIIDFNEIPEADRTNFLIDLTNGFFNLSLIPEEKQEEVIRRLEVAFNKKGSTGDAADKHPNTIKLELYRAEITTNTIPLSMSEGADRISFVEHQRRITKLTHQDHDFTSERIPDQKNHHVKEPIKPSTKPILDNSKETELGIARKELREAEMIIQKQDTKNAQLLEWKNQNSLLVENMAKDYATSLQSKNMEIANLRNSSITDLASLKRKYESLIEVAIHILGRKKELSKPGNLRNSPLIEEGNSAAHGGRCLADLQRMEIKPMDGDSDWFENAYSVTVEGAQSFKGSSAFRKLINMRFDLRNLEHIDLQIISEFETTFQKIKTQINESLPAEGETDEDDACIMEVLLLKDPVAKVLFQEVCSKWVAAVDRDQTTRKEIMKDLKAMSFGRKSYLSGRTNRSRWNKGSRIMGTISEGVKSAMEKIL
ncbi:hypothetical protein BCIN_10g04750 [Botrytis cinerea B05.10]|uniref:Uncharacterized protein n=2 Tax=Botryotinia fuckeliana TaxID=40559 RepID=A0A384JVT9_BOTFB|nr:hypothetical protein BCIN_10g04750 [Botrytis cinerea B05.10]ATZ54474.1 hypothetical protein BCIN_10g04750 [Botrytis cinerea B05.10]CCD51023.1 hypothetical protein BofuT4_P022910.1 [Botrytis cinerea T4]